MTKRGSNFSKKASVRERPRKKHAKKSAKTWMAAGFDLSMSSVAGAAIGYDGTLKRMTGPDFTMKFWGKDTHYFERITDCANADTLIHELQERLGIFAELDEIYIAVEEPFPVGMVKRLESKALKQQAEISGAFLAGLLRYGYKNIFQISWYQWAQLVAAELGITIHHSKWSYKENPFPLAPSGKGSGKWRSKEWARMRGVKLLDYEETIIPDWPDLINHNTLGKIPRPETSKAKAAQPDDRYDALGVMNWMVNELQNSGLTKN
jgi:hypothetical protein